MIITSRPYMADDVGLFCLLLCVLLLLFLLGVGWGVA